MTEVPLTFKDGVDESQDPQTVAWSFQQIENLRYERSGELVPRDGMRQELAHTALRTRRFLDMGGEPTALVTSSDLDDASLVLYRRQSANSTWHAADVSPYLVSSVEHTTVFAQEGTTVKHHSVAVFSNYRCHAISWTRGAVDGVSLMIFDGDTLVDTHEYAGLVRGRVVLDSDSNNWVLFAIDPSADYLVVAVGDGPGSPCTWNTSPVPILAVYDGDVPFDFVWPEGDYFHLLFLGPTQRVIWAQYNKNFTIDNVATLSAAVTNTISVALNTDATLAVWAIASSHVRAAVLTPGDDADVLVPEFTVFSGAAAAYVAVGGGWLQDAAVVYASSYLDLGSPTVPTTKLQAATVDLNTGAVAALSWSPSWGVHLASVPIYVDGREYVLGATYTDVAVIDPGMQRHVLLEVSSTQLPVPVLAGPLFVGTPPTSFLLDRPQVVGDRIYFSALEKAPDGTSTLATLLSTLVNGSVGQSCYEGVPNVVATAGGLPVALDSRSAVEHVPIVFPVLDAAVASAGTGVTGIVQYKAIYEIQDAQGRIGRSAPSPATSPLSLSNQRGQVTIPRLDLTRVPSNKEPRYKLYRSTGGGLYYLVISDTLVRSGAGSVTYYDSIQDLSANEVLYTESGELSNQCPPFLTDIAVFKSRLWGASGSTLYWTKELRSGYLPQWCDEFKLAVPTRITAIAPLQEILLVLCEDPDSAYYVSVPGEGPDDLGVGAYPMVSLVSAEVGCPAELGGAVSAISVANQVFWRSRRGLETIGVAQAVQQAGPADVSIPILKTLASYPYVLDVTHLPEKTQIVWALSDGSTGRKVVVFDYKAGAWTTLAGSCFSGVQALGATKDSLLIGSTTGIWRADSGLTYDLTIAESAKAAIVTVVQVTGNPFGFNGWGRIKRMQVLGQYRAPASVALAVNLSGYSYTATATLTAANWTVGDEMPLDHKSHSQKCAQIGLTITATPTVVAGSYGSAPIWRGLNFTAEKLSGHRRPVAKDWVL